MKNDHRGFANVARSGKGIGDRPQPADHPDVEEIITKELDEAGITDRMKLSRSDHPEVPSGILCGVYGWSFHRNWYYWVAKGPGIPPEHAIPFDQEWGTEVRADGDCACRGAAFWGRGFGVGMYHIDTQEGLNAFVQLLARVHKPAPEAVR
jgi:hypothetical protein